VEKTFANRLSDVRFEMAMPVELATIPGAVAEIELTDRKLGTETSDGVIENGAVLAI
jgi:hypothetical protein